MTTRPESTNPSQRQKGVDGNPIGRAHLSSLCLSVNILASKGLEAREATILFATTKRKLNYRIPERMPSVAKGFSA